MLHNADFKCIESRSRIVVVLVAFSVIEVVVLRFATQIKRKYCAQTDRARIDGDDDALSLARRYGWCADQWRHTNTHTHIHTFGENKNHNCAAANATKRK